MNIIVVGCGKVGEALVEQLLLENHNVTVIEQDEKALRHVTDSLDVMGIQGNGAILATQREAGVKKSDVLIAVTDSDEINMLCCLIAKKEADCSTIARIRNPEYGEEVAYLQDELGLAAVINPEMAAAKETTRLLRFPSAMKIDSFSTGGLDLIRAKVPTHSPLVGKKLMEFSTVLKLDILVCIIERGEEVKIPSGADAIEEGDILSFIAKAREADRFFAAAGIEYTPIRNCMIVGGGRTTFYVMKRLQESRLNIHVKVIEIDPERCEVLADAFPKATIINGDGTDQDLLDREGLGNADAFCSLTGFDEENIMLSLYTGKNAEARLVTKINRKAFESITKEMNIGSIIFPKKIVAEYIVQHIRALENSQGSNVRTLYKIADGRAEALEFAVENDPELVRHTFADLRLKPNVLVGGIVRKRQIITPGGSDYMLPGDRVIIVTSNTGFHDLRDILAE